jgi:hypothetical protein
MRLTSHQKNQHIPSNSDQRTLCLLITLYVLLFSPLIVTGQINGKVIDKQTNTPIPFANISSQNGNSGTITNMEGKFTLPPEIGDSITISCVGYFTQKLENTKVKETKLIFLEPRTIQLNAVNVFPGENPALKIMKKVVERAAQNNPDLNTSYSCILYHKMTFSLDIPDSVPTTDSVTRKFIELNRNNHLMLMESVSEKKHLKPDKFRERLISGRVSGLKSPSLAVLPSQIQPFGFYSKYIGLLDIQHLNPVSEAGLKHYLFLLKDTIVENGDSLFYITFQPRSNASIKPLTGSFHIHKKTYAIKNIKASSKLPSAPFQIEINQSYKLINDKQWFPNELESKVVIKPMDGLNSFPYPMTGRAKSLVTAINLNPDLNPREFSTVVLEDDMPADTSGIDFFRYEPLTRKDSSTYHLIDSIGRAQNLDKIINFQKELIRGYIPAGPLLLDIEHILGYNKFEGLKLGLGAWTDEKITGDFSVGGYYNHAFKADMDNYGGGIKWKPAKNSLTGISCSYNHDMHTTGSFDFHDGDIMNMESLLKSIAVNTMDRADQFAGSVEARFWGPLSGKVFFSRSEVKPVKIYNFSPDAVSPEASFTNTEFGIKLRWAYKETLSKTAFGIFPNPSPGPKLWVNLISGIQAPEAGSDNKNYTKLEAQLEKTFRTGPSSQTTFRILGGIIDGWDTPSNLYSFFGTYDPFSIEIPYMFATMAPNEFAADRFALVFLNHKIPLRQNKQGSFKPEINLMTRAGWGDIRSDYPQTINTFKKGFYESGILVDNLLKILFVKYGCAVHYRYGPYHKAKGIDNWSFRLSVDFSF